MHKENTVRTILAVSLITASVLAISSHAHSGRSAGTENEQVTWLPIPEVHARAESAGFRNIERIEREGGRYEVKATDPSGQRIKLFLHPRTGEILERRTRDESGSGYARSRARAGVACNERRCRDDLTRQGSTQPTAKN